MLHFWKIPKLILYHVDLEKRGGCGWEEPQSQKGELLAKAKQLKIFPLFKILTFSNMLDFIILISKKTQTIMNLSISFILRKVP